MALTLKRKVVAHSHFINIYTWGFIVASAVKQNAVVSDHNRGFCARKYFERFQQSNVSCRQCQLNCHVYCTSIHPERLNWDSSSHAALLNNLESALKDHQLDEAWEIFNDIKRLYGFPNRSVLDKFVTVLSYSSKPHWLQKACDLVHKLLKEKSDLLYPDMVTKLLLSLARAQMPLHASTILRLMLQRENLPPMNLFWLVFLHMVKSEIGTYLASNLLVDICDRFLRLTAGKNDRAYIMKLDTMIFNLVLDALVRFGSSLKGQQIIELMAQVGVVADAHTIITISRIHEMNGQRDELKKFKDHIDRVSGPLLYHYQQFYNSLLSLLFKFDDMDDAAELVLGMYRGRYSFPTQKSKMDLQKPHLVSIGSHNLRAGLKIQIVPELLPKDSVLRVEGNQELVVFRNGKLLPTNKALAKLIYGYKRLGKISELSNLLYRIQKEFNSPTGSILCPDVINACIRLGWLETAHDILDDMEAGGSPMESTTYMLLLAAYYKGKKFRHAEALLKQMRKAGLAIHLSNEMVASRCLSEMGDRNGLCKSPLSLMCESELVDCLVEEMRGEKEITRLLYELNSSIYFFCKAKMIGDALKTYRKMQKMKIQPTVETFAFLVYGYSSLEMYRDITILWGDIKRNLESGLLKVSRDLFEFLLMNLLRAGYFERVMEVIGYMEKYNLYADKWMYKSEFLKLHKNLYRSLSLSKCRTEAQSKRLEHVRAFRKWVGID